MPVTHPTQITASGESSERAGANTRVSASPSDGN